LSGADTFNIEVNDDGIVDGTETFTYSMPSTTVSDITPSKGQTGGNMKQPRFLPSKTNEALLLT